MQLHKKVYFITTRLARRLPFVPNKYVNSILLGIIARGAQRHRGQLTICGFVFLSNHYHLMLVTKGDPAFLPDFMNWVNGEIAKFVKKLLGLSHEKIWEKPYNDITLLDSETALRKFVYMLANPVAANFVERAAEWYGCGTFQGSLESYTFRAKYIRPSKVVSLPSRRLKKRRLAELVASLKLVDSAMCECRIDPLAWIQCFPNSGLDKVATKRQILQELTRIEAEHAARRRRHGINIPRRKDLELRNPHAAHTPKRNGRQVFCMSSDTSLRVAFIEQYDLFCRKCSEAYQAWRRGDFSVPFPPGAFIPPNLPRASIVNLPI
ncbi:MAG: hypothetical protein IT290_04255 [Deltaproteobacteria bacterium]|nr:hypothetical protein [Deltaproteobacteria bacterium]